MNWTSIPMLLIGLAAGWWLSVHYQKDRSAEYHWKKISDYDDWYNDPDYQHGGDFSVYSKGPAIDPHLAILEARGKIVRWDMIIPDMACNTENMNLVREYEKNPWIVFIHFPYAATYRNGEVPLAFSVWFKEGNRKRVKDFYQSLNEKYKNEESGRANKSALGNP